MIYKLLRNISHDHLALFSDTTQAGISTTDKEHRHLIIPDPGGSGNFVTTPGEDGHTHELEEYVVNKAKAKESDTAILKEQLALFKECTAFMKDALDEALEDDEFHHHKQWDDEIIGELDASKKTHATLNHIEPMIDILGGYQRQNRSDLKFLPIEEGDQAVADILNVVVKVIMTMNSFEAEETRVFEDTSGPGLGVFNIFIDYSENLKGQIKVERFSWKDVRFGPHENPDLRDCEYLFKLKWFSKKKLAQLYPEEYEKIGPYESHDTDLAESESHSFRTSLTWEDQGGESYGATSIFNDPELYDGQKKIYRVLERWQKEFINVPVIVFMPTEEAFNALDMPKKDINRLKEIEGAKVFYKETHRIRIIKTAGNVILEDFYPDLAYNDFHLIPVFGKHYIIDNELGFNGKIRGVKEPQRVINKSHSQIIDQGSKVVNRLLFYDEETFGGNKGLEDQFKAGASMPGHVQKVKNKNNIPTALDPPSTPMAVVQTLDITTNLFYRLSNVNPESYGQQSNATSGKAILLRKQAALVGNEYLFDNLALAKKLLGRRIVAMIQKIYTPDRILRIIEKENARMPIKITQGGQQVPLFSKYRPEDIATLLEETDLTAYDIAVSESPLNATTRQYIFWSLVESIQTGATIPPEMLIKYSEMTQADKEEAIMYLRQQQQMTMQQEQMKYGTEIAKSQIAAQSKARPQQ